MKKYTFLILLVLLGIKMSFSQNIQLDTFPCLKSFNLKIEVIEKNLIAEIETYAIHAGGEEPIIVVLEKMKLNNGSPNSNVYFNVSFPGIQMNCDLKKISSFDKAVQDLCKFKLFNRYGLDTLKAETYTVLKGKYTEKEKQGIMSMRDSVKADRSVIAQRDLTSPIIILEEDLMQNDVKIGTYELDSMTTITGVQKQFKIYNSIGALVCDATQSDYNNWILLTYKNSRYHKIGLSHFEIPLYGVLTFLIKEGYL